MKFIYTVDPLAEKPIMLLNDDIGFNTETGKGIDGAKFMAELMALDAMRPKSIEIWINSPGGVVMDGYNIYAAILKSVTKVDTVGVGCMASIAAVIFQAGRTRTMMDYSWLMYHNPFGGDDTKVLEVMRESISKMVARSGKPEAEILAMMQKETYITAQEALEYGFADAIENSAQHNRKRMAAITEPSNFHKEANLILNKLFDTTKASKMSKLITNKLGLNDDATEDSILRAIENMQNKAKTDKEVLEAKIADLEKKMNDDSVEIDKLKKEKDALEKAKDKAEAEKCEAEEEAKTQKAKNAVEEYAKVGRIKNDPKVIDFWTEQFKADEEIAKEQIEALPLNKTAPVINKTTATGPRWTAGAVMAKLNAKKLNKENQNR
ncbi:Clp protease ClpP [Mucilaginibacter paludis]|uniref:ATP-dependent Clp protease proteolytic subunit n=1 Tax=Mucilaginibacter paludis DSM 18603 TaxID=714943 RepID=H1YAY6_9SPHI|nr:Clp protease ClpP [Mucilaginibacter paludis]EHQ30019.1 peptidase S14 ClpP [Mucilaginibacter paludis DSM 18603]